MKKSFREKNNNKTNNKRRRKYLFPVVVLPLIIVILIFFFVFAIQGNQANTVETPEIAEGQAYLTSLGNREVSEVENKLVEARLAEKEAETEQTIEQETETAESEDHRTNRDENIDIYSIYAVSSIFGDSRAAGFTWSGVLDSRNVCAATSMTLRNMPDFYDQMLNVYPSYIFINYGMNDMGIGYWDNVYEWCDECEDRINDLKSMVPSAEIYIVSVFPVIDPAFELSDLWYHIDEWNAEVEKYCPKWGVHYIDMTDFVYAHQDLYDIDGIHFAPEFYPLWAEEMVYRM